MMPDWEIIQAVWPLLIALGALWARIEVALSQAKQQSIDNAREIEKLEIKADAQGVRSSEQAVQLARIEQALVSIGGTLDRLDKRLSGS